MVDDTYNAIEIYYENVEIHCNSTEQLADFLFSLDQASLHRVRDISVDATRFLICLERNHIYCAALQISSLLQLFPGLQLSTLKVQDVHCKSRERGDEHDQGAENLTYNEVGRLIQSDGFKRLRYSSPVEYWMLPNASVDYPGNGRGKATKPSDRNVQPECWDKAIKERDGEHLGSEVKAFQLAPITGAWHYVMQWFWDYTNYDEAENVLPDPGPGCLTKIQARDPEHNFGKGILGTLGSVEIRVTRGRGVKYVQSGKSIDDGGNDTLLHELFKRFTWSEIKKHGLLCEDIQGALINE
ncbi:MAG: hypothetical protein Q9170_004797 [Blastenia crenularia]